MPIPRLWSLSWCTTPPFDDRDLNRRKTQLRHWRQFHARPRSVARTENNTSRRKRRIVRIGLLTERKRFKSLLSSEFYFKIWHPLTLVYSTLHCAAKFGPSPVKHHNFIEIRLSWPRKPKVQASVSYNMAPIHAQHNLLAGLYRIMSQKSNKNPST